jgi:hypothetical protein
MTATPTAKTFRRYGRIWGRQKMNIMLKSGQMIRLWASGLLLIEYLYCDKHERNVIIGPQRTALAFRVLTHEQLSRAF